MFEYMAHKKPIIASNLPVLKEVLNPSNSILVDPENPEEWVEAIVRLSDKKLRCSLGKNAYGEFIKKYSWNIRAKNLTSIIMNTTN